MMWTASTFFAPPHQLERNSMEDWLSGFGQDVCTRIFDICEDRDWNTREVEVPFVNQMTVPLVIFYLGGVDV